MASEMAKSRTGDGSAHAQKKIAETSPRGCDLVTHVSQINARFRGLGGSGSGRTFYLTVRAFKTFNLTVARRAHETGPLN